MRARIGGVLDYRRLSLLHRPRDEETLRAAAVELGDRGLTERDIGEALGLDPTAVSRLLRVRKGKDLGEQR
jgi:ParB-like chromosome segregation protein Spo0J